MSGTARLRPQRRPAPWPALAAAILVWLLVLGSAARAAGDVTVEGNRFLRDGVPWVAEGVTLVGFVAPEDQIGRAYGRARALFGPELLDDIRAYGADVVRFQVSQTGLDPRSPFFDPDYRGQVLKVIRQTRKAGFNVIVSMQWQRPSGYKDPTGMPSATTRRAWRQLAGGLAEDRGILLEVFNEPALVKTSPENWERWRRDMQSLIDVLRKAGSQNVLLVGGLGFAHYFTGAPELHDPFGQLGYTVHPFLAPKSRTRAQWDERYGDFAATHPVMATAFMANSAFAQCRPTLPQETEALLAYLREKDIGLVLWAFDLPLFRKEGVLSTFDDFQCGPGHRGGAGEMIRDYFQSR